MKSILELNKKHDKENVSDDGDITLICPACNEESESINVQYEARYTEYTTTYPCINSNGDIYWEEGDVYDHERLDSGEDEYSCPNCNHINSRRAFLPANLRDN